MKVFGALGETEDGEEKEAEQGSGGAVGFTEGNRGAAQMGGAPGREEGAGSGAAPRFGAFGPWHPGPGTGMSLSRELSAQGPSTRADRMKKKSNGTKEERTRHGTRAGRLARRSPHGGRDRLRALRPRLLSAQGREALLRAPQNPWRLPTCPPRVGGSLWRRRERGRAGPAGGRGARRECQRPASRVRAPGGPAPPLERSGDRRGEGETARRGREDRGAAVQTFRKGLDRQPRTHGDPGPQGRPWG